MRGEFVLFPNEPRRELIIPNNVLDEGEESFLKMICRADVADVASGGDFYIGLCNHTSVTDDMTLADLTEPTAAGGYARQAITRDATGWPTLEQVNGVWRMATDIVNFTAAGADFDQQVNRLFLCNAASGTVGVLFAISGKLSTARTVADGQTLPVKYRLYLN